MSDPVLKTIFTANAAEFEKEFAKMERKVEGLEHKIKRLGPATKDSLNVNNVTGLESALASIGTKTAAIAAGGLVVQNVLQGMTTKAKEFHTAMGDLWNQQGPEQLKMQIAGVDVNRAMPGLKSALWKTPALSLPEMSRMQTEIAGAGFADADIQSGAAAGAMLRVRAGMGTFGKDSEAAADSAKAISGLLAAQGSAMGAADIERVGMKTAALAAKTNLQFADLKQLSQAAGALTQMGVDESKMLAAFSVTSEAGGSMTGGTSLKNIALRLGTAMGDKEKTDLLKGIGLTPEDVAISKGGLDFTKAGETLRTALTQKSEVEKNAFYARYFGGDAVSGAALLFSDPGFQKYKERVGITENAEGEMATRLETFEMSRVAVGRRNQLKAEFGLQESAMLGQTWNEQEAMRQSEYISERAKRTGMLERMGLDLSYYGVQTAEGMNKMLGMNPEAAGFKQFIGLGTGSAMKSDADWAAVATRQLEAMEKQNELMQENNRLLQGMKNERPVNRNAQVEQ